MKKPEDNAPNSASYIPILITSSIIPQDVGVKLLDPEKRLYHALEAISHWIRVTPNSKFVLCDGSNFDFRPIVKERFPETKIECLYFQNNQEKIVRYGRGYGEGEIIQFALNHSVYLRQSDAFAKCSSKLWVENFTQCMKEWRGDCLFSGVFKNAFSLTKTVEMVQVDTRFYLVRKTFYSKHLSDAHHKIGIMTGYGIEDSFHDILLAEQRVKYLFSIPPVIKGVGGGTGKYYRSTWLRILKEQIRIKKIKKSLEFRHFFY